MDTQSRVGEGGREGLVEKLERPVIVVAKKWFKRVVKEDKKMRLASFVNAGKHNQKGETKYTRKNCDSCIFEIMCVFDAQIGCRKGFK